MNSFRAVEKAMEYEAVRHYEVWQETHEKLGDVPKQTRGWDDVAEVTRAELCDAAVAWSGLPLREIEAALDLLILTLPNCGTKARVTGNKNGADTG